MAEQCVLVDFFDYRTRFKGWLLPNLKPLKILLRDLEKAVAAANAGEVDGFDMDADSQEGRLYFYGPNADNLYAAVAPVLINSDVARGGKVTLRYGAVDDEHVKLVSFDLPTAIN